MNEGWEVIRDSGYATPLDQPDVYNALLASFITAVRQDRARQLAVWPEA